MERQGTEGTRNKEKNSSWGFLTRKGDNELEYYCSPERGVQTYTDRVMSQGEGRRGKFQGGKKIKNTRKGDPKTDQIHGSQETQKNQKLTLGKGLPAAALKACKFAKRGRRKEGEEGCCSLKQW